MKLNLQQLADIAGVTLKESANKVMIKASGGGGDDVVEYKVGDFKIGKDWVEEVEGVWTNEDEVIVVGRSERECVQKLKKYDSENDIVCKYVKK